MNKLLISMIASVLGTSSVFAAEFEIAQKNKQFTTKNISLKVGDSVKFTNEDPFFHNIFSLSELKTFDLGSYPKGEFRTVKFEKTGVVEVECAIHPNMFLTVEVE